MFRRFKFFGSPGRLSETGGSAVVGEGTRADAAGSDADMSDADPAAPGGATRCSSGALATLIHNTRATAAVASDASQPKADVCHHLPGGAHGAVLVIAASSA
jgi:hypothetical protein